MEWPERVYRQSLTGESFVQITLIDVKGSAPQILGAKALVGAKGLLSGTVGGGKVEAKAIVTAQELLKGNETVRIENWNLIRDVGMTCGGVVSFLFEVVRPANWRVVVFGAGHVAQELVPLLCRLECQVTCVDNREEWLSRLPESERLVRRLVPELKSVVKEFNENSFFILITQGHATDVPVLIEILNSFNPPFVGVIGSRAKAAILKGELRKANVSEEKILAVHCPIGLSIGNNTPIEISLSILAQLLQERDRLNVSLSRASVQQESRAQEFEQTPAPQ